MAVLETKIYRTKQEIKNAIKDIEKKPDAGDHIVSFFINWLKFALLNIGVGVASTIGGSAVGAIAGGSTGAQVGGLVAAGVTASPIILIITFVVTLCCTKILHVAGSINDKKKQINKIIKAIDDSIPKAKKSDNDKLLVTIDNNKVNCQIKYGNYAFFNGKYIDINSNTIPNNFNYKI